MLETVFGIFETREVNGFDGAKVMPMVVTVSIVVADDTAVIALEKFMINVRQVVPRDLALFIYPYFPSQLAVTATSGDDAPHIFDFHVSHDL
ncbi:hypothetical protein PUN4_650029 [Paraburkholderia unamae]|nr:hypothetical protein PUN4_650029 [Paraburkholderia unamae]